METELVSNYSAYFHFFTGKLVIIKDGTHVLLAKRKGELEYDGVWNFPGGRKERTDANILENLQREKNEELGTSCKIRIYAELAYVTHFIRKDGIPVIVSCFPAIYEGGEIELCEEYSEYKWCPVEDVGVTPRIPGTEHDLQQTRKLLQIQKDDDGSIL